MENSEKALIAKDWIRKLADGINPLDGSAVPQDDIVNNVHISRCLFYVSDLIDAYLKGNAKKTKNYELAFSVTPEDLAKVCILEQTVISTFVREINKVIPMNMKPLSYPEVLNWLTEHGYMREVLMDNGRKTRRPTEAGNQIGITTQNRMGLKGEYISVEYNASAQRFILDHLMEMTE